MVPSVWIGPIDDLSHPISVQQEADRPDCMCASIPFRKRVAGAEMRFEFLAPNYPQVTINVSI